VGVFGGRCVGAKYFASQNRAEHGGLRFRRQPGCAGFGHRTRRGFLRTWSSVAASGRGEKQIERVKHGTVYTYGELEGITGSGIPAPPELEMRHAKHQSEHVAGGAVLVGDCSVLRSLDTTLEQTMSSGKGRVWQCSLAQIVAQSTLRHKLELSMKGSHVPRQTAHHKFG